MINCKLGYVYFVICFLSIASCSVQDNEQTKYPTPTDTIVYQESEENEENALSRELWIEKMHRSAPGKNWREIEYNNSKNKVQVDINSRQSNQVFLGDSLYQGRWEERGSVNQAGSINAVSYLQDEDMIYCISAGGTLWKGPRTGTEWQVVNQSYKFDVHALMFVKNQKEDRMISTIARIPHYSDDLGLSWKAATGINSSADFWSRTNNFETVTLDDGSVRIYCLSKESYFDSIILYYSDDLGASYDRIENLIVDDFDQISLCKPHGSQEILVATASPANKLTIRKINHQTINLEFVRFADVSVGADDRIILIGNYMEQDSILYAIDENRMIRISKNAGLTWEDQASTMNSPWDVGFYNPPSDPSQLFYGNIEAYRMEDNNFIKVNTWAEYYSNTLDKLHADIMTIKEFTDPDGNPFILIGNHGGLSISTDYLRNNQNISLNGLNVAQYYDVRTDPRNSNFVYAGSQDQGYQRTNVMNNEGAVDFDQVLSGDYGHLTFSGNGEGLWTGYPGGRIRFYLNPQFSNQADFYEVVSEDESSWLTPMAELPTSTEHEILVAGGNINGGFGSHLIKLKRVGFTGIQAEQFPYDFTTSFGSGTISAIEASSLNPDLFYVATDDGLLYTSLDGGVTFEVAYNAINQGHYLYGASIYASKINENEVWIGGSGYDNDGVLYSNDYGKSFSLFTDGLPATLVFEITANADETQFYAATEAGPYIYLSETARWEDLSQGNAPVNTYWSVEYLEEQKIVRYGTYGRGILDFNFDEIFDVATNDLVSFEFITAYPNPVVDVLNLEKLPGVSDRDLKISMFDVSGRQIFESGWQSSISMQDFASGIYTLRIRNESKLQIIQIAKL